MDAAAYRPSCRNQSQGDVLWILHPPRFSPAFSHRRRLFPSSVRHCLKRQVAAPVPTQENSLPSSVLLNVPFQRLLGAASAVWPPVSPSPACSWQLRHVLDGTVPCHPHSFGSTEILAPAQILSVRSSPLRSLQPLPPSPASSAPAAHGSPGSAPGNTPPKSAASRRSPPTC
jgi:hypothetical protein